MGNLCDVCLHKARELMNGWGDSTRYTGDTDLNLMSSVGEKMVLDTNQSMLCRTLALFTLICVGMEQGISLGYLCGNWFS